MSDERWERLLRSWATVLGLSDTTTGLAKEFFQRIRRARVWGASSLAVAIYMASIVTGEYVPLPVLVRRDGGYRPVLGRMIYNKMRYNAKKLFGVDLDVARVVEVEIRGWCRVLRLDPVLCEASVCTAVNTAQDSIFGRAGYARFVALILRFVAKRLGISLPHPRLLPQSHIHRKPVVFKRAEKHVDACIERARQLVATQPP
jgi:hypothetical protein